MTRPHVVHVVSNIKGGVDVELSNHVLVTGRTGQGKSRVINALELALTGKVSDIAGRGVVAREADLFSLAPPTGELFSKVTLSTGEVAEWHCARGKKAKHTIPGGIDKEGVFPLRGLEEAITGDPTKGRQYLLDKVAGSLKDDEILAHVPENLRSMYAQVVIRGQSPIDNLLGTFEAVKTKQRQLRASAKASGEVSIASGQGRPALPTDDELKQAEEASVRATAEFQSAVRTQATFDASVARRAGVASLSERWRALTARREEVCTLAGGMTTCNLHPLLPAALQVMTGVIDGSLPGECPVCGGSSDVNVVKQRFATIQQATCANRRVNQLRIELQQIDGMLAQIKQQLSTTDDDSVQSVDVESFRQAMLQATDMYRTLSVAKESWRSATIAHTNQLRQEQEAFQMGQLASALEGIIGTLFDTHVASFIEKVQLRMPKGEQFVLQLRDGTRDVLKMGLQKGEQVFVALSGGQWAFTLSALADVVAKPGLSIITPPDRMLDGETLLGVLSAFDQCDSQVIVTSVVPGNGFVFPNWKVISC